MRVPRGLWKNLNFFSALSVKVRSCFAYYGLHIWSQQHYFSFFDQIALGRPWKSLSCSQCFAGTGSVCSREMHLQLAKAWVAFFSKCSLWKGSQRGYLLANPRTLQLLEHQAQSMVPYRTSSSSILTCACHSHPKMFGSSSLFCTVFLCPCRESVPQVSEKALPSSSALSWMFGHGKRSAKATEPRQPVFLLLCLVLKELCVFLSLFFRVVSLAGPAPVASLLLQKWEIAFGRSFSECRATSVCRGEVTQQGMQLSFKGHFSKHGCCECVIF